MVLQVLNLSEEPLWFQFARIFFRMDFSEQCLIMLPYVQPLAAKYGAEVILLHVETANELAKAATDQLRDFDVRRVLYDGDPAAAILGFAKSEKIDLIAMPTHGYGTLRRFLIGSVTAKVLHDAACPVLTGVHIEEQRAVGVATFSHVLCAIDLGPQSADVLKRASQLATHLHSQLDIVHAVPPVSPELELLFRG